MSIKRLKKELSRLIAKPPEGISCYQNDDKLNLLIATVTGPSGSPYEGGLFKIEIEVDSFYPFRPPKMQFLTKVYHPNIDNGGRICMDLLKTGGWNPMITIENLLIAVQQLLGNPNPDDPLMPDIANEYRQNKELFEKKAKKFTQELKKDN